jgi:hypothetical protein
MDLTGRRIPFVIEVMSNKEFLLKTEISGIKIMKLETKLGEIVKKLPFSFE